MAYPPYLREKARKLRREKRLTIDELAECLALSRTTIYYWVRDLPIERKASRQNAGQRLGNPAMQAKYRKLRETAYAEGRSSFQDLAADPLFRDFVALYIAEGFKRNRNVVSMCNSDPAVVRIANGWLRRLSKKRRFYRVQHHADQDLDELRAFWAGQLAADPFAIRFQRKSNSAQLAHRRWRSEYGVLTVGVNDTLLRARLQGWIDCMREQWLISAPDGV
jgi:transcriptional regulator with XRE-family HTH domain